MKHSLRKIVRGIPAVAVTVTLMFGAVGSVHAQTTLAFAFPSLKSFFESHLENDRVNAANNRDERNTLLEAKTVAPATDNASSTLSAINDLSQSLSNLENIESRIDARAAETAGQGYDVSAVTTPLAEADDDLSAASSTIASLYQSYTDLDAATFASSTASTTATLGEAKSFMENALDALKSIVGN